jgi:hypothetical protein
MIGIDIDTVLTCTDPYTPYPAPDSLERKVYHLITIYHML